MSGSTDRLPSADRYERMMRLARHFAAMGEEMRERSRLGRVVLADEAVAASAELSPTSWERAEEAVRTATTGARGLEAHALELDADALVVRATVLTYRWIDELQDAAYRTLGSIAGRAVGYLAPEVELGGAIVSAGLIETDALDREGVSSFLGELAEQHPELMEHVTSGGGALVEGLQLRSLLTAGATPVDDGGAAARGGLRAAGVPALTVDASAGLRDVAGAVLGDLAEPSRPDPAVGPPAPDPDDADHGLPRTVEQLLATVARSRGRVAVQQVAPGRFIAYLPSAPTGTGRLRLVSGDGSEYVAEVSAALSAAVRSAAGAGGRHGPGPTADEDRAPRRARVMLVGCGRGGVAAAAIAAAGPTEEWEIDQLVVAGAPSAQVPVIPPTTRVLALEDRTDPVVLLGSLVNAGARHRLTVTYDGSAGCGVRSGARGEHSRTVCDEDSGAVGGDSAGGAWLAGARAVDAAADATVRAEIERLQQLGYLAG